MSIKSKNKIRLFVNAVLEPSSRITLPEEASHYLCNVMRLGAGEVIACFNNAAGEFDCRIEKAHKKQTEVLVLQQNRKYIPVPDIWVLFAPVKKDKTDFIVEKSVELGCRLLQPVITERTVVDKIRGERYQAQAVEAAEQCRRVDLPEIAPAAPLAEILAHWDCGRTLFFMDETGTGVSAVRAFDERKGCPAALLVGPEGGFSPSELELLRSLPYARAASLGPRILRAETAVAAALSVWQSVAGDWQ